MENEETQDENIDSQIDEEVVEDESTEVEEDDTDNSKVKTMADYDALEQKNKELYERAKKAEALAKANKGSKPETNKNNNESLTREEGILLIKGYDEEDLNQLNLLANGKKLTEVINNDMFVAWKESKDAKAKSAKAQLGSSKGSTSKTSKPTSEMTPEEHKAYWQSQQ